MIIRFLASCIAAFSLSAFAAENCAPLLAAKPFLYRLENANTSFLILGTRHAGVELSQYPDVVREVIDTADQVMFELKDEPGLWFAFKSLLAMHRGTEPALSKQLTPQEFAQLLRLTQMKPDMADRLTTFGASMMCLLRSQKIDFKPGQTSLDDAIRQRAKASRRRILGLEKGSVQLAMMKQALDLAALKELLVKDATVRSEERNEFLLGDEKAREAAVEKIRNESFETWKMTLADRNEAWVPLIEKALARRGRLLLVVGVNHLFGSQGLIDLFAQRGFSVTRVEE